MCCHTFSFLFELFSLFGLSVFLAFCKVFNAEELSQLHCVISIPFQFVPCHMFGTTNVGVVTKESQNHVFKNVEQVNEFVEF